MKCPNCGHGDHRVVSTTQRDTAIDRMRECAQCRKRWKTVESLPEVLHLAQDIVDKFRALQNVVGEG